GVLAGDEAHREGGADGPVAQQGVPVGGRAGGEAGPDDAGRAVAALRAGAVRDNGAEDQHQQHAAGGDGGVQEPEGDQQSGQRGDGALPARGRGDRAADRGPRPRAIAPAGGARRVGRRGGLRGCGGVGGRRWGGGGRDGGGGGAHVWW